MNERLPSIEPCSRRDTGGPAAHAQLCGRTQIATRPRNVDGRDFVKGSGDVVVKLFCVLKDVPEGRGGGLGVFKFPQSFDVFNISL